MFESSYKFRYVNHNLKEVEGQLVKEHKLTFCCKNKQRYIVNVEQYNHYVYSIKFFSKAHRFSENKYRLLTKYYDAPAVIMTCIRIMIFFYKANPYSSFIFVGENGLNEKDKNNTKRFKVYKRIMETFFAPVTFAHYTYVEKSAYLMLNKDNTESNLLTKIESVMHDLL